MADYPRRLVRGLAGRFFPVLHALPVAPALGLALFLTRRRGPVLLLGLPLGPLPRLLSTRGTAVTLRGSLRRKGLLTALQQTHPRPRPACWMHASGCLLIFGSVCRTFRKAHGRYSSQKLMPRRGTSNSSPGRSSSVRSPTVDQRKAPVGHNTLYLNSLQNGPAYYLRPPPPPPNSGGPLYTGPPQWTSLKPPLTHDEADFGKPVGKEAL